MIKKIATLFLLLTCIFLHGADFAALQKKYPDAPAILLYDKEETVVNHDGTSSTSDLCSYIVMNYQGRELLRNLQMHFNSDYGELKVVLLQLTKKDGRVITLDPLKLSKISIDSSQMASRIFDPAQKNLAVNIPGLEIGDTLTVKTIETIRKPRIPGAWSDIAVLQFDMPIIDYEYIVHTPQNMPLCSIAVKDEVPGTLSFSKKQSAGKISYFWRAKNVPQVIPEPYMPPLYTCVQRVLVSTVEKWEDISKWYAGLCEGHLNKITPEMRAKTASLTAGKKSDMEKINALFQFVSQEIRYTGITDEETAPGYEPHDVDFTFSRRHGVCRDKAALLAAMLKIAGFKAHPVLFMSGAVKDSEVPNIYFNHAITAVEKTDGGYILMDPTFETTRELFPAYLAGKSFLAAKKSGDTLRKSPETRAEDNLLKISTTGKFALNGTFSAVSRLSFSGFYDQIFRAALSGWTKSEIREYFAAKLRAIYPGSVLDSLEITPDNIRNMNEALGIKITFSAPAEKKFSSRNNNNGRLLDLPRSGEIFGQLHTLYRATRLFKRKFPLETMPRMIEENISVTLPETVQFESVPAARKLSAGNGAAFSYTGKANGKLFQEKHLFAINSMRFSPQQYNDFKAVLQQLEHIKHDLPVISGNFAADADSVVLAENISFDILSSGNWDKTYRIKRALLNFSGADNYTELRVNYISPAEKVSVSGTVTTADQKTLAISAKEINHMDDSRTSSANRYLKRKIAVVSFPGITPGSTIDCTVRKSVRNRLFFSEAIPHADPAPVLEKKITVTNKNGVDLKISSGNMKKISTRNVLEFTGRNFAAIPDESNQPPAADFAPAWRSSGGDYTKLYNKITGKMSALIKQASPEIKKTALEIAGKLPLSQRAAALEKFVYTRIRQIDLPLNEMLLEEFSLPQTILSDAYGSSTDRAILLAALLDAMDIKYRIILVSDQPFDRRKKALLEKFPQHIFTTVILETLPDKIFLNDSGLYGKTGTAVNENNFSLDESGSLNKLQVPLKSSSQADFKISLHPDNSADITAQYTFYGNDHLFYSDMFARSTPQTIQQFLESRASGISLKAKITGKKIDFTSYPGKLILQLNVPDFAGRSGKYIFFPLPEINKLSSAAMVTSGKRQTPFLQKTAVDIAFCWQISVPEKYSLQTPAEIHQISANGEYRFSVSAQSNGISAAARLQLSPGMILPEKYDFHTGIDRTFSTAQNKYILLDTGAKP